MSVDNATDRRIGVLRWAAL